MRASAFVSNPPFVDHERIEHASPLRLTGHPLGIEPMDLEGRSGMHTEVMLLSLLEPEAMQFYVRSLNAFIFYVHLHGIIILLLA